MTTEAEETLRTEQRILIHQISILQAEIDRKVARLTDIRKALVIKPIKPELVADGEAS